MHSQPAPDPAIDAAVRRALHAQNRALTRTPGRKRGVARVTWRASRALARHSFARRRPLAPFVATGLLYVAGVVFAVSPHGPNTVVLFTLPLGLLTWWRAHRRGWRTAERVYAAGVFLGGFGWLQATAVIGFGPPMPGWLAALFIAAAVPWWWHHRIRTQIPDDDDRFEVWAQRVAGPGGALPGSRLYDVAAVATGWSASIALVGGKQTTIEAISAAGRIASAYGVPSTSVVIEAPATGEAHRARLLVLTRNPLQTTQMFTGPQLDLATGQFPIGVYADGTTAYWRLFTPGSGACHGLIAGTTGSGKSTFINLLCTEIRHSGVVVLWLADPEEGVSVPDWQDAADWFAPSVPEIRRMLQAAERVMNGRKKRRARRVWTDEQGRQRRGLAAFDPTPGEPQLTIVIDESPDVMNDPDCVGIIALIAKKGRKLGVSVDVVAQVPSVGELGGNVTIRSMVSSMNIVMFRTSDRLSGKMGMPKDLPVDPVNLPEQWPDGTSTAGLGYVASAGGRVSPMRGQYVEDPYYWATCPAPSVTLDQAAAEDAGEDYTSWRARRDDDEREPAAVIELAPIDDVARSTRDAILAQLREHAQIRTGALAERVGAPLPTVSSTLRRLEQDGLAVQVRHGVWSATEDPAELAG
jgi:DNA-binding transcriptional ArsR family regulator